MQAIVGRQHEMMLDHIKTHNITPVSTGTELYPVGVHTPEHTLFRNFIFGKSLARKDDHFGVFKGREYVSWILLPLILQHSGNCLQIYQVPRCRMLGPVSSDEQKRAKMLEKRIKAPEANIEH